MTNLEIPWNVSCNFVKTESSVCTRFCFDRAHPKQKIYAVTFVYILSKHII